MKSFNQKLLGILGLTPDQFYGIVDYAIGVLLITLPWFFVSENNMTPLLLTMFSGVMLIVYSMFTDYRHGITRWLSAKLNVILDIGSGVIFITIAYPLFNINYLGVTFITAGILIISFVLVFEIIGKRISFMPRHSVALS